MVELENLIVEELLLERRLFVPEEIEESFGSVSFLF